MAWFEKALIKSVRVEPVETQASRIKGFDELSPNGRHLFSISLMATEGAPPEELGRFEKTFQFSEEQAV